MNASLKGGPSPICAHSTKATVVYKYEHQQRSLSQRMNVRFRTLILWVATLYDEFVSFHLLIGILQDLGLPPDSGQNIDILWPCSK